MPVSHPTLVVPFQSSWCILLLASNLGIRCVGFLQGVSGEILALSYLVHTLINMIIPYMSGVSSYVNIYAVERAYWAVFMFLGLRDICL